MEDSKQRLELSKTVKARSFDMVVCLIVCLLYLACSGLFVANSLHSSRWSAACSHKKAKSYPRSGPIACVSRMRERRIA